MGKVTGRGRHPNSKKALEATQVKKGGPGKPGAGRPDGSRSLKDRLDKYLVLDVQTEMPNGTVQDIEYLDAIILSLMAEAKKGNTTAIKELFDRKFGKEPEKIEIDDKELRKTMEDIKDAGALLTKHDRPY